MTECEALSSIIRLNNTINKLHCDNNTLCPEEENISNTYIYSNDIKIGVHNNNTPNINKHIDPKLINILMNYKN